MENREQAKLSGLAFEYHIPCTKTRRSFAWLNEVISRHHPRATIQIWASHLLIVGVPCAGIDLPLITTLQRPRPQAINVQAGDVGASEPTTRSRWLYQLRINRSSPAKHRHHSLMSGVGYQLEPVSGPDASSAPTSRPRRRNNEVTLSLGGRCQ